MGPAVVMAVREGPKLRLTRREGEVAALVAKGLSNREIAHRLFISERTVDAHLEHIREKLGVNSRAQIAAWFVEAGNGAPADEPPVAAGAQSTRRSNIRMAVGFALVLLVLAGSALAFQQLNSAGASSQPAMWTLAGDSPLDYYPGGYSGDFGPATAAQLSHPMAVATDGYDLYIADSFNHVIRRVDRKGVIRTVAGGGFAGFTDGANATSVALPQINGLAIGRGGRIFFSAGPSVYRVDPDLTIHQLGLPGEPPLVDVYGLALDHAGNLYLADRGGDTVRRLAADGRLSVYAGTGTLGFAGDGGAAVAAELAFPTGLALDSLGNLLIADQGNNRIRRIDQATGIITTVAGSDSHYGFSGDHGPAVQAKLSLPGGVATIGSWVYVSDTGNNRVRAISPSGTIMTLVSGLYGPWGVVLGTDGNLVVADSGNNRVREISIAGVTR